MITSSNLFAHRLAACLTAALLLASRTPIIADTDRPDTAAPARVLPGHKLAQPSPVQYAWHEQERIQFVCLDPCTWQGREYDDHSTPLTAINPTQLDTDQWCRAARLWRAKQILFVAKHGVLLLNSTPNTNGLIPADDLKLYEAFGREIARRFRRPIAEVKDRRGTSVELVFPRPTLINYAVIMEDYREGERIREYLLEGFTESQWLELSKGTSVGRKKIDRFGPVQVQRVRFRVGSSVAEPLIRALAVFCAP